MAVFMETVTLHQGWGFLLAVQMLNKHCTWFLGVIFSYLFVIICITLPLHIKIT